MLGRLLVAAVAVSVPPRRPRRPRLPLPYLAFPAFPALRDTRWPLLRCFAWSVVAVVELTEPLIVAELIERLIVGSSVAGLIEPLIVGSAVAEHMH